MNDPKPLFSNPYSGLPDDGTRFNAQVSSEEYNFVKCIRPKQGTMVNTINTLYHKLVLELRKRGIRDLTHQQQFEDFVARCVIVLPEELNTTKPDQSNESSLEQLTQFAVNSIPGILANLSRGTTGGDAGQTSAPHVGGRVEGAGGEAQAVENKQSNVSSSSEGTAKPKRVGRKSKA